MLHSKKKCVLQNLKNDQRFNRATKLKKASYKLFRDYIQGKNFFRFRSSAEPFLPFLRFRRTLFLQCRSPFHRDGVRNFFRVCWAYLNPLLAPTGNLISYTLENFQGGVNFYPVGLSQPSPPLELPLLLQIMDSWRNLGKMMLDSNYKFLSEDLRD
jgi:hypothetical protein